MPHSIQSAPQDIGTSPAIVNDKAFVPAKVSGSRASVAYDFLYQQIRSGAYASSMRIVEEDIAQLLGISRTPVREALHRLQSRGLVEIRQGRGFFVVELSRNDVVSLYAFREAIEGTAARFAAQHAMPHEIDLLRQVNESLLIADEDAAKLASTNRHFHQIINEASHNKYLIHALQDLHDAFSLMRQTTLAAPGRARAAHAEHVEIIEAIAARDGDRAEELLRSHVRKALSLRLSIYS